MKRFIDFLTESDDFTNNKADIQNDPYKHEDVDEAGNVTVEKIQKVFDPVKWRKYLQYANAGNN